MTIATLALLAALVGAPDPELQKIAQEVSAERVARTIRTLVGFHTRHSLSDPVDPARGIGAARRWIREEMEKYAQDSGRRLHVEFDSFIAPAGRRIPKPTEFVNVVATLPGSDPQAGTRVFVVGGHYDSIPRNVMDTASDAAGANDDASGTAVALECARVLSKRTFPATLVFIAFVGEEQGLVGSRHWAQTARQQGLRVTMLNNDIVGGNRGSGKQGDPWENTWVRIFSEGMPAAENPEEARARQVGGGEADSPSRQLARYVEEVAGRYLPSFPARMVYRRDRFGRGGDHTPFNENGFPAVRFAEAYEDFTRQHQNVREEGGVSYGDLLEFVSFDYIANVARVNALSLASLAWAPAPPVNVRFVPERGVNSTKLSWDASPDGPVSGYEIVWRDTTVPRWEHVRQVGNVTGYTFPDLPKDNFFFGVRSVDERGHSSLVVFPKNPPRIAPPGEPPAGPGSQPPGTP